MMDSAAARLPPESLLCEQTVLGLLDPHRPSISSDGKAFLPASSIFGP